MSAVPPPPPSGGLQGLLAGALRGAGDVLRGEIALFRQEMADNLHRMVIGLAAMAGAAVFAVVGFLVLVDALLKWLATVVGSEVLSALIVGVAFLALGAVLALIAKGRFSLDGFVPSRTSRQIRLDAVTIKERVTHDD